MVEKQIYSCWAFSPEASEKRDMNFTIYKELKEKYKIAYSDRVYDAELKGMKTVNPDEYDIIVKSEGSGYAHTNYRVIKNAPNLTPLELALICDGGNLCFGGSFSSRNIKIYTD